MEAEMAAVADFFDVLSTVTQALDEASPPHERALRSKTSKSSKGTKKRSKNGKSVCKEELRQCREDSANADESYLYIQTAGTCHLERTPLGQGFEYFLVAALGESTYKFSDRPAMMEEVVATSDFVSDFASTFAGSPPNVGLTFVDEASGEFKDPVVVSASSPTMTGGVTTYKIDQSPFQQGVESLDSLFNNASLATRSTSSTARCFSTAAAIRTCPIHLNSVQTIETTQPSKIFRCTTSAIIQSQLTGGSSRSNQTFQ